MLEQGNWQERHFTGAFAPVYRRHEYKMPVKGSTASASNLDSCGSSSKKYHLPSNVPISNKNSTCYMVPFARTMRNRDCFSKIGPRLLTVVNCLGFRFVKTFFFLLVFMKSWSHQCILALSTWTAEKTQHLKQQCLYWRPLLLWINFKASPP